MLQKDEISKIVANTCDSVFEGMGIAFTADAFIFLSGFSEILNDDFLKFFSHSAQISTASSFAKCLVIKLCNTFSFIILDALKKTNADQEQCNNQKEFQALLADFNNQNNCMKTNEEILRIKDTIIKNSLEAFSEFLGRFSLDYNLLCEFIGEKINIKNIFPDIGDTHNNGHTVYKILTVNNSVLYYKPHSLYNDFLYENVQTWFVNKGTRLDMISAPTLQRDDYGWQKSIEYKECKNLQEINNYMIRTGYNIFLAYLLLISDLHVENIIASGEYPVIVDLEALFANITSFRGIYNNISTINKEFNESVFLSHLLPDVNTAPLEKNKTDLSALGSNKKINTIDIFCYTNAGTSEMTLERKQVELSQTISSHNIPTINGTPVPYIDYLDIIVSGFEELYDLFLSNKAEFLYFLMQLNPEKGKYRQVLRATSLYSKFLLVSHKTECISDPSKREMIFTRLKGKDKTFSNEHLLFIELEKKQLLNEDVPYFYAKFDDTSIYTVCGDSIPNFFIKSIKELLLDRINKLDFEDKYKQVYFIRASLTENDKLPLIKKHLVFNKDIALQTDIKKLALSLIKEIFSYRDRFHRLRKADCYECYTIVKGNDNDFIYHELHNLYNGIGSVLFLAEYINLFNNKEDCNYYNTIDQILDCLLNESNHTNDSEVFGVFTGQSSYIYLLYRLYKIFGRKEYYDKFIDFVKRLDARFNQFREDYDVLSGLSGVIILLHNIIEDLPTPELKELQNKCTQKLLLHLSHNFDSITRNGFSHGRCGIATALLISAKDFNNIDAYDLGIALYKQANKELLSNDKFISSWCNGLLGEITGRCISLDFCKEKDKAIIDTIDPFLKNILKAFETDGFEDILCHGRAGTISVLLWYSKKTHNMELYHTVEDKLKKLSCEMIENGVAMRNRPGLIDVSFMLGLSGIGYMYEQFVNDKVPCVLAFEV